MEFLEKIIAFSNDILWSYVLVVMLIALGLWFSLKTKFVQLRMVGEMIRLLKEGTSHDGGHAHISSFQAFWSKAVWKRPEPRLEIKEFYGG